jgi:hypothetical protein
MYATEGGPRELEEKDEEGRVRREGSEAFPPS